MHAATETIYTQVGLHPARRAVVRALCQTHYAGTSAETKLKQVDRFLAQAHVYLRRRPPARLEALIALLMADELAEITRFAKAGIGRG